MTTIRIASVLSIAALLGAAGAAGCARMAMHRLAHEALDLGHLSACTEALTEAEAAFARIFVLSADYCRGPWENWYRGATKLNLEGTLKRTRDVLQQARLSAAKP